MKKSWKFQLIWQNLYKQMHVVIESYIGQIFVESGTLFRICHQVADFEIITKNTKKWKKHTIF